MHKPVTDSSLPPAIILNMHCTGLGIARNLGPYGIPVIGISSRLDAPGHFSTYSQGIIGPDSRDEPGNLLDLLISLVRHHEAKGILFPTKDDDVHFVDRYRKPLEDAFAIPQVGHEVLDVIMSKDRLARAAENCGISSPKTLRVSSLDELEKRRDEIVFPSVVKAVYAYQWHFPEVWQAVGRRKAIKVETSEDLFKVYQLILPFQKEILVQEWVSGPDDQCYVFGAYFNLNSECLGSITAQKLLQYPPNFGLGCLYKNVHNEEVQSLGIRLLKSIGFSGIAEVEFKKDGLTDRYRLIEINPRHWDQHTLATACGVNLSYLAYQDLCGKTDSIHVTSQRTATYWVRGDGVIGLIKEDLKQMSFDLDKIQALFPIGRKVYSIWDRSDPYPFCRRIASMAKRT